MILLSTRLDCKRERGRRFAAPSHKLKFCRRILRAPLAFKAQPSAETSVGRVTNQSDGEDTLRRAHARCDASNVRRRRENNRNA
ncbi:hypothetical protein EVAR_21843_1 [Eumeta japonica]|uniref:Uncharacterized protein n=1 Tax=Eumeta variegata TaxID=151549 RepID=A0A4C1V7V3_EUMVA|nr:hypothetical protein EVAR_21843_1 [Eumeta japonica]